MTQMDLRTKRNRRAASERRSIGQVAFLLGALLIAQVSLAQQVPAGAPGRQAVPNQVAEEELPAKPNKPGTEGIRIHGHWVINVKNPDGTIVQHREFDNSLVGGPGLGLVSGDQLLGALISGVGAAGGMGIAIVSGPVKTPGYDPSAFCSMGYLTQTPAPAGVKCFGLVEANSLLLATGLTHVLNTTQTGLVSQVSFVPAVSIVLSGNFTVLPSYGLTIIDGVQTYLGLCIDAATVFSPFVVPYVPSRLAGTSEKPISSSWSPQTCAISQNAGAKNNPPYVGAFTSTNLATPVTNLIPNQSVYISVTLSFS